MGQFDLGNVGGKQDTPVLIINLDRSPDRLSFQRSQALRLGLRFERIPAADGVRLLHADFEQYAFQWLRPLSRTEVGCLLSHAACWWRVVELKRNAIVLEDDIVLAEETVAFLGQAKDVTGAVVVNLETRAKPRCISPDPVSTVGGQHVHELYRAVAGAAAYLVTPLAAARLLKGLPKKAALADVYLWGCSGIQYLQIDPALGVALDVLRDRYGRAVAHETATTIRRPQLGLLEKLALLIKHPAMRMRRAHNQLQIGMTRLVMKRRALMRTVAPSPSIFVNYEALKGAADGAN
jgi:glycosyl transferase family 25